MTTPSSTSDDEPPITIPDSLSDVTATTKSPTQFRWKQTLELGYVEAEGKGTAMNVEDEEPICFHCGKDANQSESGKLSKCSRCQVASYCSRECQVTSWKGGETVGHKHSCAAYKRVGDDMMIIFSEDKDAARQDILSKVRFYAYPYAVQQSKQIGRGFLFIQSDASLSVMSLPGRIMSNGREYIKQRSVILHWMTTKEFTEEVCLDDFELAQLTKELRSCVEEYNEQVEVPVLMRFRCGHCAVGLAPLVPDYKLCLTLGKEYYGQGQGQGGLQLNIDDM